MKAVHYTFLVLIALSAMTSCKKGFLQRTPQTDITPESFFKTTGDLETYSNGFYRQLGATYEDIGSDNISTYISGGEVKSMLNGTLSAATVGGWNDWNNLRTINNMLGHAGKVTGDQATINHYIGIARFFRARFYFAKIKRYSNVPWYGQTLTDTDEGLYKAADPRALVADSMLADLEYAAANIKETEGDRTRVSKWSALALMSRICLFEGTYRKYHPELNLQSDYTKFLEKSVWAAEQLMASKRFSITGNGPEGFRALFSSTTLNGNKEMIQWLASSKELSIANNSHTVFNYQWGLSSSLMETFLMKDGTRFTDQPDYATKTFTEVFTNRDPRLSETISYPGYSTVNDATRPEIPLPSLGGFIQLKFYPRDPAQRGGWQLNYTGLPLFRYAEVLLNYIEAKAELGSITQDDLEKSVNVIRARVAMPAMQLAAANAFPDPVLAAYYPTVSGSNKGLMLELRRERRVELACEGLRFDDLQRWYAGKKIEAAQKGIYVPAMGALDVTGDSKLDIAILPSPTDTASIADLPADVRKKLARFYLKNADGSSGSFYLSNQTSGNIVFTSDVNSRTFIEPRYYYRPIPLQQTTLNTKLKQPFGW